jgi:hypothetical protein
MKPEPTCFIVSVCTASTLNIVFVSPLYTSVKHSSFQYYSLFCSLECYDWRKVLENVEVKETIISICLGFQRNTVPCSGYVQDFLFSTSATNILGNCITFYHQQYKYDGHGNSTSAILYRPL